MSTSALSSGIRRLAVVAALALFVAGCAGAPGGVPRLSAAERDAMLDTIAKCHLLRVVQSGEAGVTDASVIAAVERYKFEVRDVIGRAEALIASAQDPVRRALLRTEAEGACTRLAAASGSQPGLVRFDDAGNLGKTWLVVEGEITDGFAERTIASLRQERAIGLLIRSPGGSVYEARILGRWLRQNGMRVAVDDLCTSACVDVLAGGVERYVTATARLGIHQSQVPRQLSSHEGGQLSVAAAALYLREMGVDNRLALEAAAVPHEQLYWIPLPEALETGLATRLVPRL